MQGQQVLVFPLKGKVELNPGMPAHTLPPPRLLSSSVAFVNMQLSDLLKEKRQEVENDHTRQMQKLKEAHREALARTQGQLEEEVRLQACRARHLCLQWDCREECAADPVLLLLLLGTAAEWLAFWVSFSWQEQRQRAELQAALRREREHLEHLHEAELEALREKQEKQLRALSQSHQEQVG